MANCSQAIVTIQKVKVHKSESYGVFGEPGASAEWDLKFTVAGQAATQRFDGVRDGSVLTVNRQFLVDLNSVQESLFVEVSGVEIDDSSKNDILPTATQIITPKTNWEEGQTFSTAAASHDDFTYDFVFDIRCATELISGDGSIGGSGWSGWFQIQFPGQFIGDLAISSFSPDHLQLFGVGTDGQMYSQYWLDAQGWSNWIPMGGLFNPGTNPAAISRKPNTVEVFCRGKDNTVYQNYWPHSETGDWSGWFQIQFPGQFSGDLAVCSASPDHLQLFGIGTDGQMYSQYWLDAQGWSNWIPMGGLFNPGTNPAAISRKPNTVEVFCRGKDNTVYQNYWPHQ